MLNSSADTFGSERALCDLAADLKASGHEILIVTPDIGPAHELFSRAGLDVDVCAFPTLRKSRGAKTAYDLAQGLVTPPRALVRIAQGFRATTIYSNTSHTLSGPALARAVKADHIWHLREIERLPRLVRRSWGRYLLATGHVVAISRAVATSTFGPRMLRRHLDRRMHVIHDGINVHRFKFEPPPPRDGGIRLVLPGRIASWKGHDLAIAAVSEANPNVNLKIIGSPATAGESVWFGRVVAPLIERNPRVEHSPATEDQTSIYRDAQFLLQTSVQPEPFGRTVIEAMACGVLPIVSDVGGPSEVVRNGIDGFVYRFSDARSLRRTIESAATCSDRHLRDMSIQARRRVEQLFSSSRNAHEIATRVLERTSVAP